ncbi:TonB-dependent receptor plug domain-containing protein [Pontibacter cellulosilyticus]|uniref:TonB-dependent receptor n=1 Tax=Pontibacter cellulosilyticus TaxID=1720253 RepID=A0A923N9H3_9BACT|nr:TonB-dependent receptor [Pontibacter cellulosilyticus]MBC5992885.1 TonB-dependent receptor [Pontibacter cellulosilyticus]
MARFSFLKVWLLGCCLSIAPIALAQQQDTTRHQLHTVEVFGKPAEVYAAGSRVAQLDSSYLDTYASGSLAQALQARTPLYLKSYGVSGISTVAFRGTNASQTAILWNGLNISSPTLGQTDFATLPVSGFGNVAVQYGPAAATYGSGAIGGAVLLNSPDYKGEGFGADVQTETGSFGRYFGSSNVKYGTTKVQAGTGLYYGQAANNFKYKDLTRYQTPEVRQENAAVSQYGITQDLVWQLAAATKFALHGWYTFADREVQPAMGSAANKAQLQDKNLRLMAELEHNSRYGQTAVKAALFNDYLQYTSNTTASSISDVNTYQLQAEQAYTHGNRWSLRGGINLQHFAATNSGYAGEQSENRASAFALLRYDPASNLKLSLNLRQAIIEGYNPKPTPALGFDWKFYNDNINQLSLKGNVAGSYRAPTLNDRFWVGAGNPDLKPEQGWSYESGLRHLFILGNTLLLETELTAYHMLIDDWIQWSPDAGGRWRPVNLFRVAAEGIEANTKATITLGEAKLSATAGYTYTSSEQAKVYEGSGNKGNQLMYVPRHKAVLGAVAAYKGWSVLSNLNYTGIRYTNNSESNYLKDFMLLDLALSKRLQLHTHNLVLTLRSDNVTNATYQTMAYHAMPPRGYTFSLRFIIP